ncbi:hypothetical protein RN607_00615 [Demequina capsici]|uniref:Uncharacterized protein n=1 Tax=Demequina capsici TaxID=3075620 RepID=A0AA96FDM9_9MICO|nr:hypothetical protein [Demequina sp. PMTSA13]WNM27535.1 hypothetical protein RN607_00615 [Demequina sp. PMTSA13]
MAALIYFGGILAIAALWTVLLDRVIYPAVFRWQARRGYGPMAGSRR